MTITVTQHDIESGTPCHVAKDPIALAMRRAGLRNPKVGTGTFKAAGRPHAVLPPPANRFREAFDAGKRVRPFSFSI